MSNGRKKFLLRVRPDTLTILVMCRSSWPELSNPGGKPPGFFLRYDNVNHEMQTGMEFLDPTNGMAFIKIFGTENRKHILISFLNSILQVPPDRQITSVTLLNPNQAPQLPGPKNPYPTCVAMTSPAPNISSKCR